MSFTCPHCSQTTRNPNRCTNCGETLIPEDDIPVLQEIPDPPKRPRFRPQAKPPQPEMSPGVKIVGICVAILFGIGTYAFISMNRNSEPKPQTELSNPASRPVPKVLGTVPHPFNEPGKGIEIPRPPEAALPPPLPPLAVEGKQLPAETGHIVALAWDRAGQSLYVSTGLDQTWTFRPSTTVPERTLTPPELVKFPQRSSTTISPSLARVAITHHGGYLTVGDLGTGQTRVLAGGGGSLAQWEAAFSPNGSRLATGHGDAKVRVWNLQTGQVDHVIEGFKGQVMSVTYNRVGSILAATAEKEVRLFAADSHDSLNTLVGGGDFPFSRMEFLEDDSLVGLEGKKIHWIQLKPDGRSFAQTERTVFEFNELAINFTVSADRKWLLVAKIAQGVELWDVEKKVRVHHFSDLQQTAAIAFHPADGRVAIAQGNRVVFYHLDQIAKRK
jgi:hypothetical protein